MGSRMNIEDFNLEFDPKQFLPGSLERRAFGSKPVRLTKEDIEYASNGVMIGLEGDTCFFTLKNYSPEFQSGTQVLVNRTTGQVILYPPGSKNFLVDMARGLYSETQQKIGKKHFGSWSTDSDEIEINPKTKGLSSPSAKRLTQEDSGASN